MAHGHGHGHSHGRSHRAGGEDDLEIGRLPRAVLLGFLAAVLVATVVGVVALWPDHGKVDKLRSSVAFAAPGVTFPDATVESVAPACPVTASNPGSGAGSGESSAQPPDCGTISAQVEQGEGAGTTVRVGVPPEVTHSGLEAGDTLNLTRTPAEGGASAQFAYFGVERDSGLWLLLGLFALVVLAVARFRGLFALIGLAFSGLVVLGFVLPGLLSDEQPVAVALVGSVAILYVVLYLTHGVSIRTSAALAGTVAGVAVTAGLGWWAVSGTHLSGVADESGGLLNTFSNGTLDLQGLATCGIVIAGLGVLNDVTITQASSVWELRAASPAMSRARVFASGMRIGRDHIASTIYTIVFAYAGTALTVLLVIQLYDRPLLDLVGTEEIAEEIVRSLVSSIGLVLAVPLTTAIAVLTVPGGRAG